ncbi:MAG: alpha/beta fold hydrolase [Anaerolineae bacterium]
MSTASAQVNGCRMSFVDAGVRAPLLLVHGFPVDGGVWEPQVKAFSPTRRVIAPDLAGFGASGSVGRRTMAEHGDDMISLVDTLGIGSVVVVGLSMGGYIAFSMWRRHRERIAALALVDTRAGADTQEQRAAGSELALAVEAGGMEAVAGRIVPPLLSPGARRAAVEGVGRMVMRQRPSTAAAALKAMAARQDATPLLATIDVPVLVAVGAIDTVTPPDEAQLMADAIPNARLVMVPRAGHLASFEEPGAFNGALRAFLESVDAAG